MIETQKQQKPIITLLHMQVDEQDGNTMHSVYTQLTPRILEGAPTLVSSTLAKNKDRNSQESYLIISQWQDLGTYQSWEVSGEHRQELRPIAQLTHGLRPETFYCVG